MGADENSFVLLVRHDEVQKTPQFFKAVLQRCSSDQESVVRVEILERFVQQGIVILQPVGFVHHQTGPADGTQEGLVLQQDFVCRQQSVELEPLVARVAPLVLT